MGHLVRPSYRPTVTFWLLLGAVVFYAGLIWAVVAVLR